MKCGVRCCICCVQDASDVACLAQLLSEVAHRAFVLCQKTPFAQSAWRIPGEHVPVQIAKRSELHADKF